MEIKEIKEIRNLTGLSQSKFCEKYHIPLPTLRHWERGDRECLGYVLELLEFKVRKDMMCSMLEWNTIEGYNDEVMAYVNIENGVKLPEFNRELLFERHDGKLFLGEFMDRGRFNSVGFRAMYYGDLMDDVGLNGSNINGVKWAYINRSMTNDKIHN